MNQYAKYFTEKFINDIVIMNEDPCIHTVHLDDGTDCKATPIAKTSYTPQTKASPMQVKVFCPVCQKEYPEAEKRLKKEISMFMARLSETSMLDEVSE